MKKGIITMMALMLGISGMMAQNTVVVAGAGDVTIKQGEILEVKCDGDPITFTPDGTIILSSYKDYDLTMPDLRAIRITGSGDLESKGQLTFPNLDILISGTGDAKLTVECDTINAILSGIGDLVLNGHCRYLKATIMGLGDLDMDNFTADSLAVMKTRNGKTDWNWDWEKDPNAKKGHEPKRHKTLIFDPNWSGIDIGLNMLLGPGSNADFTGEYALLEQRTMKSWNYNFNIADVGLAFTHTHRVGIYTGIGFGLNTFRFNNPVRLEKGETKLICNAIDETVEGHVKKSKLGVLYLQAPLMLEVRPTRNSFIALGVTGGVRIDSWNKIKFDDAKIKTHGDYYINRFKLDASLRAGKDDGLGFFTNYNLLPFFSNGPDSHCVSFGLSLNF